MVLSLRTPTFRNFTFAELREDVVVIIIIIKFILARVNELVLYVLVVQLIILVYEKIL